MKTVALIFRYLFSLRYKVQVKGIELLNSNTQKLFLPNHQAIVDPQILTTQIFKYTTFIPFVSAKYLQIPLVKNLFIKMKSVPVSNMQSGRVDVNIIENLVFTAQKLFANGENVLVYPAGQMAGQGFEKIFNKSGVFNMIKALPDNVKVIGIRTHGLWGSIWSKAWNGKVPPIIPTYLFSVFIILANLIFFVPRRKVYIEFVDITTPIMSAAKNGKEAFIAFLEKFYSPEKEKVSYIRHFFYLPAIKRKQPAIIEGSLHEYELARESKYDDVPDSIVQLIKNHIYKIIIIDRSAIRANSSLILDLHMDSLALELVLNSIQHDYPDLIKPDYLKLLTVGDICRLVI